MTPKTSLVTAVAVALVAVPAAWGAQAPDAFERAVATQHQSTPVVSPDVIERAVTAKLASQSLPQPNPRGMLASDSVESARQQLSRSTFATCSPPTRSRAHVASRRRRRPTLVSRQLPGTAEARDSSQRDRRLGLGPRDRVVADRDGVRARDPARARPLPGDALHADPPARSLNRVIAPADARPPSEEGGRACQRFTSRRGARHEAVSAELVEARAERARPPARATRADGAAHAPPHRSRPQDGQAVVDAGLDRGGGRGTLARRALRRPELGEERTRSGLGRAAARSSPRASGGRGALVRRMPFPCSGATTSSAA